MIDSITIIETENQLSTVSKEPPKKEIDMSVIPECMLKEGYEEEARSERTYPECVGCPVCKEIMINPTTLGCGHSFCGDCFNKNEPRCSVCSMKHKDFIIEVNWVLKDIIEQVWAAQVKERSEYVSLNKTLKRKRNEYCCSDRCSNLALTLSKYMLQHRFANVDAVKEYLSIVGHQPPVCVEELLRVIRFINTSNGKKIVLFRNSLLCFAKSDSYSVIYGDFVKWMNEKEDLETQRAKYMEIFSLLSVVISYGYFNRATKQNNTMVVMDNDIMNEWQKCAAIINPGEKDIISPDEDSFQNYQWLKDVELGSIDPDHKNDNSHLRFQ
jgi:hypothetical protein